MFIKFLVFVCSVVIGVEGFFVFFIGILFFLMIIFDFFVGFCLIIGELGGLGLILGLGVEIFVIFDL